MVNTKNCFHDLDQKPTAARRQRKAQLFDHQNLDGNYRQERA